MIAAGEEARKPEPSRTVIPTDYKVGRGRPPLHSRFKKGQSGHPEGRPAGRANNKTLINQALRKTVSIELGDEVLKVPLIKGVVMKQGLAAIQGDPRAAVVVHKFAVHADADGDHGIETEMFQLAKPSDELFARIDGTLLSKDEKIELARLGQIADLGGGLTALSNEDFARAKKIVNNGLGRDVTPVASALALQG
jgi:hypothetical protein